MQCAHFIRRSLRAASALIVGGLGLGLSAPPVQAQVLEPTNRVAFVYDNTSLNNAWPVRKAWDYAMQEMGVNVKWTSSQELSWMSVSGMLHQYKAIVFPDSVAQQLTPGIRTKLQSYVQQGGNTLVVFDAGIRDRRQFFLPEPELRSVVGLDYFRYDELGVAAFLFGRVTFANAQAGKSWYIQPGRLDSTNSIVGYYYGQLRYPMTNAVADPVSGLEILAREENTPAIARRRLGTGNAVYVGMPLGYLRARGDSMLLFATMQAFLFDIARLPRLIPTPEGMGGLVMNWHVDSAVEHDALPKVHSAGLFRPMLRQDFNVTAGPDFISVGDNLGFKATTVGRPFLENLIPYGEIGSHGGWAHDWFAFGILNGVLKDEDIRQYIALNSAAVTDVTGEPVRSYSAPQGVHPQPIATQVLAEQGIEGYYYVGDTGSPPTRTFWDNKLVSEDVWAFPLSTYQTFASLYEIRRARVRDADTLAWLNGLADFAANAKTVRLMYSHPNDLINQRYEDTFNLFLDHLQNLQNAGKLRVDTMPEFSRFMRRYVKTTFETYVNTARTQMTVTMMNPESLKDMAFEVPASMVATGYSPTSGISMRNDGNGKAVFVITSDVKSVNLRIPLR